MKTVKQSPHKIDGMALVTGKGHYTDDIAPKEALVIKVLRSPHAFARIRGIKTDAARKIPGVALILTWQDVPRIPFTRAGQCWPELSPQDTYILDEYVRHVGDAAAIVAATSETAANKALKLLKVDYEVLEPLLDMDAAVTSPIVVHPEEAAHTLLPVGYDRLANTVATTDYSHGHVAEVLADCEVVFRQTYRTQAQAQGQMETQRAFAQMDPYGRLVVVASTQVPFHARRTLATALNLPMSRIRVIKPRIGGGFGSKQTLNAEFFPALVTLITGKPSKIVYTRKDVFHGTNSRHAMKMEVTLGATKDGHIRAIDILGLSDTGAYGEHGSTTFSSAGGKVLTLYNKVEACRFHGRVVYTNHHTGGALRGFGVTQGTFALESAVNELAHQLGIDPVRMRELNMIRQGESHPLANKMTKGAGPEPFHMDSCLLPFCVERGKEMSQWEHKRQFFPMGEDRNKRRGIGMAITQQGSGLPNIDMASAVLKLNDDGFFSLLLGSTDMGQGCDTILTQIAAEALGVPMDRIVLYSADTDVVPFDSGAYASSTTYTTGNAILDAAQKMIQQIKEHGATFFSNVDPEDVDFDGDKLTCLKTHQEITLKDFSRQITYNIHHAQLAACGSFVPKRPAPPYMAGYAEVEVDLGTGKVDLMDFYGVVDCGTPINPNLCRIQAEGGVVTGLGMALTEKADYTKKGRLINDTFMEYKIPARRDLGNIHIELADGFDASGPYGAKSIGEVVVNTVPPAITEAVYQACGVRIRELPVTPEKILMGLRALSR